MVITCMKEITYNEVRPLIDNNNFVIAIILAEDECSVCKNWVPTIFEPNCEKRNIPVYKVAIDKNPEIIFVPNELPMIYFFVKDIKDPLIRQGAGLEEPVVYDLDALVKVGNGMSVQEAYGM